MLTGLLQDLRYAVKTEEAIEWGEALLRAAEGRFDRQAIGEAHWSIGSDAVIFPARSTPNRRTP